MKITFEIPVLPETPNSIGKASKWASYNERNKWRKIMVKYLPLFLEQGSGWPLKKSNLKLTRCSSREPDVDNLYSSFKWVIDSLKFIEAIEDDKPSNIYLTCFWEKAKQREGKIKITLEKVAE